VGRIAIVLVMFIDRTSKDGVMIQISYHIFTEFGAALTTVLPVLFKYCYKYCYSDSRKL
jgi:hypothetical protein